MSINGIDLRQLRYFVAVAEELNFSRAAERLHMAQPPLSYAIQMLESRLNAPLFVRTKRHVALTEAGTYLLQAARQILRDTQNALAFTQEAAHGKKGELRIGLNFSAPLYPQFLQTVQRYRRLYPAVRLIFREVFSETDLQSLLKVLHEGNLDVCFTRYDGMGSDGALGFQTFSKDYLQLCLSADHPLAKARRIAIDALRDELFLISPRQMRTPLFDEINRRARAAGFALHISQDTSHFPVLINLVAAGCGVAFLPPFMQAAPHGKIVFKPLVGLKRAVCYQPMVIAYHNDRASKLVDNFLAIARQAYS